MPVSPLPEPVPFPALTPFQAFMIPFTASVGMFMNGLDQFIVTTSLPEMAASLGEAPLRLALTVTCYLFSLAVFTPVSGWAVDRYGARNVYCAAVGVFTLASALCGLCTTLPELVAARVLQGIGGALMNPVGQLVVLRSFPKARMMRINNYMIVATLFGPLCGPLLGGFLTTYFSWPWIFYINVPVGLWNILAAWRLFGDFRVAVPRSFDRSGFALVGCAIALIQVTVELIATASDLAHGLMVGASLAATLAMVALYVRHARHASHPLLDLRLLRIPTLRVAVLWGGLSTVGPACMVFLTPLLFQVGFGMNAMESGARTFIMAGSSIVARLGATRLLTALGFRNILVWNTMLLAAMIAGTALLQAGTPVWFTLGWLFLFGLPRAILFAGVQNLAYADVPTAEMSRFAPLSAVNQQMWNTVSVGFAAGLLTLMTGAGGRTTAGDFRIMFLLTSAAVAVSLIGFARLPPDAGAHVSGHLPRGRP